MKTEKVMTTKELAHYMQLNERTVLKLAQTNKLPGIKIGGQWRFPLEAVDHCLQNSIVSKTPEDELDLIINTTDQIIPLSRLVSLDLIKLDFKAEDKDGVFDELAEIAFKAGILTKRKKLVKQLKNREKMLSTAIGKEIALPHPRHPSPELFPRPNVIIGRSKKGIDFSSPDKKKVRLFFMTCAPTVFVHLRLLAKIAKILQTENIIKKFMKASDPDEIMCTLLEWERDNIFSLN